MNEDRSLANLCFDLVELDWDAPENKLYIEHTIKKLTEKVDNYARLKKYSESQMEFLRKEKAFLQKRIKAFDNLISKLRELGSEALDLLNTDKLKGEAGHGIYRRETRELSVIDESLIPEDYFTIETVKTLDEKRLKKDVLSGMMVPGCSIRERKTVQIR